MVVQPDGNGGGAVIGPIVVEDDGVGVAVTVVVTSEVETDSEMKVVPPRTVVRVVVIRLPDTDTVTC